MPFTNDPRWYDLDPDQQNEMIAISFADKIGSDPRYKKLSKDEQGAMFQEYANDSIDQSLGGKPEWWDNFDEEKQAKIRNGVRQYNQINKEKITYDQLPNREGLTGIAKDFASGLWSGLVNRLPETTARAIRNIGEDYNPTDGEDYIDRFITEQKQDEAKIIRSPQSMAGDKWNTGAYEGAANLPTSLAAMGAGTMAAAGLAAAASNPITGAALAPALAGEGAAILGTGALTGALFYGAEKDRFLEDVNTAFVAKYKRPPTKDEWETIYNSVESAAARSGLWEAGTEAAGAMFSQALFKSPIGKEVGKLFLKAPGIKGSIGRFIGKAALDYGEELAGETVAEKKQSDLRQEVGLTPDTKTYTQAAKDVAIPVLFATGATSGGLQLTDALSSNKIISNAADEQNIQILDDIIDGKTSLSPEEIQMEKDIITQRQAKAERERIANKPPTQAELNQNTINKITEQDKLLWELYNSAPKNIDLSMDKLQKAPFGLSPKEYQIEKDILAQREAENMRQEKLNKPPTQAELNQQTILNIIEQDKKLQNFYDAHPKIKGQPQAPFGMTPEEYQMEKDILNQREIEKQKQKKLNSAPTQAELNQQIIDNTPIESDTPEQNLSQQPTQNRIGQEANTFDDYLYNSQVGDTLQNIQQATQDVQDEFAKAKEELPQAPEQNPQDLLDEYNRQQNTIGDEQNTIKMLSTDIPNKLYGLYKKQTPNGFKIAVHDEMDYKNGSGDPIFNTIKDANKYIKIQQEWDGFHKKNQEQDVIQKNIDKIKLDDVDSQFVSDMAPFKKGRIAKILNTKLKFPEGIKSRKDKIKSFVKDGLELKTIKENKVKDMSAKAYFKADQYTQDEHARRQKEAGTKTVYFVNGYNLGKTAYDYAKFLQQKENKQAPEQNSIQNKPIENIESKQAQDINKIDSRSKQEIITDATREIGIIKRYPTLSDNPEQEISDLKKVIKEAGGDISKFQTTADALPGQGVSFKDIQKRFKDQDITISPKDKTISVKFKNGNTLQIKQVKDIGGGDYQFAIKSGRMGKNDLIIGKHKDGTITLNKDLASNFTRDHEVYHALESMGMITKGDQLALNLELNKLKKKNQLDFRISDHKDSSIAREENEANTFAQILKNREKYRGTRLGKIIQKITDFLNGMLYIGRQSSTKLAKEVESGKIFERKAGEQQKSKTRYEQAAPKWYSAFQNAIESVQQKAMPAKAWIDLIDSNKFKQLGVKQEEVEWTGVKEWLAEQKGKVTKTEVADYIRENNVKLEEKKTLDKVELEEIDLLNKEVFESELSNENAISDPSLSGWYEYAINQALKDENHNIWDSLDATKENYSDDISSLETDVFELSPQDALSDEAYDELVDEKWDEVKDDYNSDTLFSLDIRKTKFGNSEYQLPGGENYQELLITIPGNDYQGQHWDEPGVIVHVRTTDRDINGKKILHIEEVQSDLHQEGRKKGYKGKLKVLPAGYKLKKEKLSHGDSIWEVFKENGNLDIIISSANTQEGAIQNALEVLNDDNISDAPFKQSKTWGLLAIKRMVRYAAENGYDGIAITQGAEQVERYKNALRKAVDKIEWTKTKDGIQLVGYKDGKQVVDTTENENSVSDAIGKSMGDSIIANKNQSGVIEGDDITISDTGMAGFYDKILPSAINKFFNKKAWGKPKLSEIEIKTDDGKYKLHYLPITQEMKEKSLREGMPMFQTKSDIEQKGFEIPDVSSYSDILKTNVINSLHPIEKLYKSIGKKIPEKIDFLLKEKLKSDVTKDKIDRANEKYVEPIEKIIGENNLTVADVDEALYARHAPEANERLRDTNARYYLNLLADEQKGNELKKKIVQIDKDFAAQNAPSIETQKEYRRLLEEELKKNPDSEVLKQWEYFSSKPSGMTDSEASKLNAKWQNNQAIQKVFKLFDAMTADKLKTSYEAGRMTEDEYNAIKGTFDYYAPLYREGFENQRSSKGISKGITNLGKDIKIRGGSTKKAVHLLANAIVDYEKTLINAGNADVAKAFLNFVKANPNKDFWDFKRPDTVAVYDTHGNIRRQPSQQLQDNEMEIKVDGETYIISAIHDTAAEILRSLKGSETPPGQIVGALSKFNRILASVNTTLNPEFVLSNFFRDFQTALANLSDTDIKKKRLEVIKNLPKALKGLKEVIRGEGKGEWAQIAKEYSKAGGKIGWIDYGKDIGSKAKNLENQINLYRKGHNTKKVTTSIMNFIEDYNSIVENGVRLAAFKTALDSGMTKSQAAMLAKELTVNFNQKGRIGQLINSLYLFANAGIQGSTRMFRMFKNNPKAGAKIAGSIITTAAATALANSTLAGDDDNGDNYYDKVDDYIKKRNMVFMIPGTKGKYVKIPLPWGYNVFWALGTELADSQTQKNYKALEGAGRMLSTTMDAFNPLQSASILQMLSPTITDPFAMVGENKTFYGSPLMPEQNIFAKVKKPDSERYWRSAREPSKFIAKELNKITGGNKVKSGMVDISPETLDLIWDTFTGGAGRFASDTVALPANIAKGNLSIKRIPGARRLIGEKSEYKTSSDFRSNRDHVYILNKEIKIYPDKKAEYKKDKTYLLLPYLKATEKKIRKLNKVIRFSKNEELKKKLKLKIDKLQAKFNQRFNDKI